VPETVEEAIVRGREDIEFFSRYFLGEVPHAGQLEWLNNAEASTNVGATANRWGKTFVQVIRHFHRGFYKIGSEWRWIDPVTGAADNEAYRATKYHTLHTAQGWDTAEMVWNDALAFTDKPNIRPFVRKIVRSNPMRIEFQNGWRWDFRTLGDDGSGVDGKSYYLITVDEAGWIRNLNEIMTNVLRLRTADVQGVIDLMGTFKPGISRDFYMHAKKAAVYTGRDIEFDFEDWLKRRKLEGKAA